MSAAFDPWAALARMRETTPASLTPANDAAPIASPWPAGVDLHLTRQAAQLSALIAHGSTWRLQPDGSLDLWRAGGGQYLGIAAWRMAHLRAARLLPEGL